MTTFSKGDRVTGKPSMPRPGEDLIEGTVLKAGPAMEYIYPKLSIQTKDGQRYIIADTARLIEPEKPAHDPVNHPKHYTSHPSGVECIDVVKHMSFCLGNVVKYAWRADLKGNDLEDLRKAQQYLAFEIEKREKAATN